MTDDPPDRLTRMIGDVAQMNSKLILLIGPRGCGKTELLRKMSGLLGVRRLNVGRDLGQALLHAPVVQRPLKAGQLLHDLVNEYGSQPVVLFDNIEILFESSMKLDPLELLKRQARAKPLLAVWPGEMGRGRLNYAVSGRPEHRAYPIDGFAPFEVN